MMMMIMLTLGSKARRCRGGTPVLVLALALATLTACPSIRDASRLRDAQDTFSAAAEQENEQTFAALRAASSATDDLFDRIVIGANRTGYQSALDQLGEIDDEQLRADGLLGSKLALEALCAWRLKRYETALSVAENAAALSDQLQPRDQLLVAALPGLILNDEAFAWMQAGETDFIKIRNHLVGPDPQDRRNAVYYLSAAATKAQSTGHPLTAYLASCELIALKNYFSATSGLDHEGIEGFGQVHAQRVMTLLGWLEAADVQSADIDQWKAAFGL
ncbi:MAG: hypothetical protein KDB53_03880 [Planctomycetes bacterium]|nr:hypothetical protein [Planctomycetota bacterium]